MKQIPLTKGKCAIVDDEDYERVVRLTWQYNPNGYALTRIREGKNRFWWSMHRYIMNPPADVEIDHINGDGLDNRKENLRFSTHAENMRNRISSRGLKGVHFRKERQVYCAYINSDGKRTRLGHFTSQEAAACAYDYAAKELHGEFARLNYPDGQPLTLEQVEEFRYCARKVAPYRGISWHPKKQKWHAKIWAGNKTLSLRYFADPIDAARAYDAAAIQYHGDKARLNNV